MALLTHIKINGISLNNAYVAIHTKKLEKVYQKVVDATKDEQTITIQESLKDQYIINGYSTGEAYIKKVLNTAVWIGGAGTQEAWQNNDRFNLNHMIGRFEGDLIEAEIYPLLKTLQIPQFEIDFTNSTDV